MSGLTIEGYAFTLPLNGDSIPTVIKDTQKPRKLVRIFLRGLNEIQICQIISYATVRNVLLKTQILPEILRELYHFWGSGKYYI